MNLKKSLYAISLLACCAFFAETSVAAPSITQKYAPYIGFEHGFTGYKLKPSNEVMKYTPRLFMGFSPLQKDNYKLGLELGYTLPANYEDKRNYYIGNSFTTERITLDTQGTDAYLTFQQSITQNSYWYLKPGVEYIQRMYETYDNHGNFRDLNDSSLYMATQVGIGYKFNNGIGLNVVTKSRFVDFKHNDSDPQKFIFKVNAQYTF